MKKKNIAITIILTFILLMTNMSTSLIVSAEEESCGDNLTWTYDESTYTLTISGTGEMYSYVQYYDRPWEYGTYRDAKKIVIDEGVTTIGMKAFGKFSDLESVEIAESVTTINPFAFYNCEKLTNVVIPDSVTFVGQEVFYGTPIYTDENNYDNGVLYYQNILLDFDETKSDGYLSSYKVKDGTRVIASGAFTDCYALYELTIPDSVIELGYNTFENCTGLYKVELSAALKDIKSDVFSGCSGLSEVIIKDGVKEIGENAFKKCISLTSVNLPASLEKIDDEAFYGCSGLASVYMPDTIKSLGEDIFYLITPRPVIYYCGSSDEWNSIEFEEKTDFDEITVNYDYKVQTENEALNDDDQKNAEKNMNTDMEKPKQENGTIIVIVVIVVVVLLAVAAFVFVKKKSK